MGCIREEIKLLMPLVSVYDKLGGVLEEGE